MTRRAFPRWLRWLSVLGVITLVAGTAAIVWAQAPEPNPLTPKNPLYVAAATGTLTKPGPAASIHGDPVAGRAAYAQACSRCHGVRGIGGVLNRDSDDGTVPELNPIDPGFLDSTSGDPGAFASALDIFLQHGSIPAGDEPELFMLPFGDRKLLTQQQIANIEAYVMQLNGVYWPDRWEPPMEIRKTASLTGDKITYQITLVNHSFADLTNVTLRDTLPPGMAFGDSYRGSPGQGRGAWSGNTVTWQQDTDVPAGGTLGPFTIVAQFQGATVPPDVAQALFDWTGWDGVKYQTSAVSSPSVPVKPAPTRALVVAAQATAPAVAATTVATLAPPPTSVPTAVAAATAVPVAPTTAAPTAAPTQAPTPKPAGDANLGKQLYASKGCSACHVINGSGGSLGPDLTHIATQPYDAMANTPDFLAKWLADPQAQKPGTFMPNPNLSAAEIDAMVAYLMTLK